MPVESRISRTFKQARPYAAVAGIRQTKASAIMPDTELALTHHFTLSATLPTSVRHV